MYVVLGIAIVLLVIQSFFLWKYQRQVKDICRQLAFLMEHDSNMMIHREIDAGGIGTLADRLNDLLDLRRKEQKRYLEKEKLIAETYTNLSHDIRTPLTSLDGYFELLEDCTDRGEQKRYLGIIHERIKSLNGMLEELFTFTKLKNESYRLKLEPVCLNRVLKETVFSYYDEWIKLEITPDIRIADSPMYLRGNKQGLERVIQNVIKNGLDHGEKQICIALEEENGCAKLQIGNQTAHPEQINIEHVFERFYKADEARSRTSTGLGLSIAQEMVKRMDGEIAATLEGNEFVIRMLFPLIDPPNEAKNKGVF
jgi:signal transduction histidine kinase